MVHDIDMPPNQFWFCTLVVNIFFTSAMCSTIFILSMTFDRFYSIIRPHKAASFNTVKRAKITIICIVIFGILFDIPHLFVTDWQGRACVPFGNAMETTIGLFYYWLSFVINFALPFVLLLIMNSFIIHTIWTRSNLTVTRPEGQGQSEGQSSKIKNSEMQIYITLLLVTFTFLILMTPSYVFFVWTMFANYKKTAKSVAQFFIFHSITQKSYCTNYGINFFLYVISGRKFRTDLINMFKFKCHQSCEEPTSYYVTSDTTVTST